MAYQGEYVIRCGGKGTCTVDCLWLAWKKGVVSADIIPDDRCKAGEGTQECEATYIADQADMEALVGLGYEVLRKLAIPTSS